MYFINILKINYTNNAIKDVVIVLAVYMMLVLHEKMDIF